MSNKLNNKLISKFAPPRGSSQGTSKVQDGRRVARVEREVQSVISTFIIQRLQAELPGLVTVSKVQIPADLRVAYVYVSLLSFNDSENIDGVEAKNLKNLESSLKTLQHWAREIQSEIGHKLKLKYVPKITFYADESTEKILKIENIISKLGQNSNSKLVDQSTSEDLDMELELDELSDELTDELSDKLNDEFTDEDQN